jgi:drug/metabolite transporter (DMT)-like permease
VGSTALAYVLLHEVPGVIKVLGALLILAGIAFAALGTGGAGRRASPEP